MVASNLEPGQLWMGEPKRLQDELSRYIGSIVDGRVMYCPAVVLDNEVVTLKPTSCRAKTFKAWIRREKAVSIEVTTEVLTVEQAVEKWTKKGRR